MNFRKMKQADVDKMVSEGRAHLELMCNIYRRQMRAGRWLLHAHPATAVSWREECFNELTKDPSVQVVKADQCQYGLTSPAPAGRPLPALKLTKFMANASPMAKLLQRRCQKDHAHQPLVSGRCAAAAFYPVKFIRTIIKGIWNTKGATTGVVHAVVEGKVQWALRVDDATKLVVDT